MPGESNGPATIRGEQWSVPRVLQHHTRVCAKGKKEGKKEKRREGEENENPEDMSGALALSFKPGVTTYLSTE